MTEMLGIDLASHQGPDFPFAQAYREGYRFATPKVSGGKRYRNEHRANQIDGARAAGMQVAAYHYMWENTDLSGTPEEEFENFKAALGNRYTDETQLGLDVEDDVATFNPQPNMAEWIMRFQDLCAAEYGRYPVLYLGTYFIAAHDLYDPTLTRSPLWLASWQDAVPAPNYWLPWHELKIWQFASQATVAGRFPIDVDKFFGTGMEFGQLGKIGTAPTNPSPIITPEVNWGPDSKGRVVHHSETILVVNDDTKSTYLGIRIDGNQLPWQEIK